MVTGNLPAWVASHPWLWGGVSGLLMFVVGLALFGSVPLAAVVAVPFGGVNWLLWRDGGPAVRWRSRLLERFPRNR